MPSKSAYRPHHHHIRRHRVHRGSGKEMWGGSMKHAGKRILQHALAHLVQAGLGRHRRVGRPRVHRRRVHHRR
jgi:hypothetical protein